MQDRHGVGILRIFVIRLAIFLLILLALPIGLPIAMLVAGPVVISMFLVE